MSIFGESKDVGTQGKMEDAALTQQKAAVIPTGIPGFDEALGHRVSLQATCI